MTGRAEPVPVGGCRGWDSTRSQPSGTDSDELDSERAQEQTRWPSSLFGDPLPGEAFTESCLVKLSMARWARWFSGCRHRDPVRRPNLVHFWLFGQPKGYCINTDIALRGLVRTCEFRDDLSRAWTPASAGMTDRDLAWLQFRRNCDHITIKAYWGFKSCYSQLFCFFWGPIHFRIYMQGMFLCPPSWPAHASDWPHSLLLIMDQWIQNHRIEIQAPSRLFQAAVWLAIPRV